MATELGIWMDKRVAKVISSANGGQLLTEINSEVHEFRSKGGSGTKRKGGPQDVVHDSKYLEREKHQYRLYFEAIVKSLPEFDHLVIFGPAQTGQKFYDELISNHKHLDKESIEVKTADSMTDNQIIAWVRDFYQ